MNSNIHWLLDQQYVGPLKPQLPRLSFMDKMIENFSCSKNDEYLIEGEMGMPLPPFVASFSTDLLNGNMLGVADEDGRVRLIDTSQTKASSIIKEWSAHSNAVFDLAWIEKQAKMVTASGDQTARLWDIEKCETIGNFRGHTRSLKSIAVQPRSSYIFLTSARDGDVMLWDTRCNLRNGYHTPINTIRQAHERAQLDTGTPSAQKKKRGRRQSCQGDRTAVTAAVFLDDCRIISSGACDGALKYWDIRKNYSNMKGDAVPHHVINFSGKGPRKHGFSSLVLNSTCSRMFAICTNNIIYEFSTTNLASCPIATYQGHEASSFYVKAAISPDDRYLLCGSGDNSAYIWRTDQANAMPWVLSGHDGEVTSVAWSPYVGDKMVTCSDDNTFKVWRLFQDTSDSLLLSGTVQRKSKTDENMKIGEICGDIVLEEDVLDLDIPEKKVQCSCKRYNTVSNGKVRVRWRNGVVHHVKDTVSNVPVRSKVWNSTSPYTVLTPKSDKCPTPTQTLGEKMSESQSNRSASRSKDAMTPKSKSAMTPRSSRIFMETWLKSPDISGKVSRVDRSADRLQTPDSDLKLLKHTPVTNGGKVSHVDKSEDRLQTPDSDLKLLKHTPVTNGEINQKQSNLRNQNNKVACKHLNYENLEKNSPNRNTSLSKEFVNINSKFSPTVKAKKASTQRTKKGINTQGCGNIKNLFLSMKHKADSSCEEENCDRKRLKTQDENDGDSSGSVPTASISGRNEMDMQCSSGNKENSLCVPLTYSESSKDNFLSMQTSAVVLQEKCTQKKVRDILDIAEESTTS